MGNYYDEPNSESEITSENIEAYADELRKLPDIYKKVQERLNLAYQKNCRTYNLRRREFTYKVGIKSGREILSYRVLLMTFRQSWLIDILMCCKKR